MTGKSILIVEDNLMTARMLAMFLNEAGYKTVCVYDGQTALNRSTQGAFDLVLLDLMLPDLDGLAVCRQLRSKSAVPVIMLTAKSTEDDIVTGLECGADDYLCKPFGTKELLARIRKCWRQVEAKETLSGVFEVGDLRVDTQQRVVELDGSPIRMTKSEFAILSVLIQRPGRVYTRDQLIQLAFDSTFDGTDRTIDTHIWSLRKKLREPPGNPRYIHSETGIGYRLEVRDAI